jgi:UDP-N-acetylmuramoyl-L-alanyl-D-glutamate--2,6-diaminopimelate ligase
MEGKLYILFGCGGDRDKSKRIVMGRIAAKFSDGAFITDDNPRNENPKKIRKQIIAGKGHEDYQIIGEEKQKFNDRKITKEEIKKIAKKYKIKKPLE